MEGMNSPGSYDPKNDEKVENQTFGNTNFESNGAHIEEVPAYGVAPIPEQQQGESNDGTLTGIPTGVNPELEAQAGEILGVGASPVAPEPVAETPLPEAKEAIKSGAVTAQLYVGGPLEYFDSHEEYMAARKVYLEGLHNE